MKRIYSIITIALIFCIFLIGCAQKQLVAEKTQEVQKPVQSQESAQNTAKVSAISSTDDLDKAVQELDEIE